MNVPAIAGESLNPVVEAIGDVHVADLRHAHPIGAAELTVA